MTLQVKPFFPALFFTVQLYARVFIFVQTLCSWNDTAIPTVGGTNAQLFVCIFVLLSKWCSCLPTLHKYTPLCITWNLLNRDTMFLFWLLYSTVSTIYKRLPQEETEKEKYGFFKTFAFWRRVCLICFNIFLKICFRIKTDNLSDAPVSSCNRFVDCSEDFYTTLLSAAVIFHVLQHRAWIQASLQYCKCYRWQGNVGTCLSHNFTLFFFATQIEAAIRVATPTRTIASAAM